jgi:hypothetical protein
MHNAQADLGHDRTVTFRPAPEPRVYRQVTWGRRAMYGPHYARSGDIRGNGARTLAGQLSQGASQAVSQARVNLASLGE